MTRCILFVFIALAFFTCNKPSAPPNLFADSVYVSIARFQDERNSKELLKYITAADAGQRAYAATAFGSVQDSSIVDDLARLLLSDSDVAVRKAAAFSIGQTRCLKSEFFLSEASTREKNSIVLAEVIESYGKVARHWNLQITPGDTIVEAGLAWGIYRAGLGGVNESILNDKAIRLLSSQASTVRMGAAYYLSRSAKGIEKYQRAIGEVALSDRSEEVRMAAALALRKIPTTYVAGVLEKIIRTDSSYRVKVNAAAALDKLPISKSKAGLLTALTSKQVNVAIAASESLLSHDTIDFWRELLPLAKRALNWRVQANLYQASLQGSKRKGIELKIIGLYYASTNPSQKAALLTALSSSPSSFEFVSKQLFATTDHAIQTAAAGAIVAMNESSYFKKDKRTEFAATYVRGISTADVGIVSIFGSALADPKLDYRSIVKDTAFLYSTKRNLKLPVDNEALQSLESVIAYFEGKEYIKPVNAFNYPINFNRVARISKDQHATIITEKGKVVLRLLVEEAPGSVTNFVSLAEAKYFDGKNFHRVVPNFVVQGGCNRGDGYGGEDYSIRSELSQRRYTTGSVGMASAGKDTEGTQWFITHSPTPHLDGKYTIFAVVESGMEIVHQLEVGDKITSIAISQ